MRNRVLQFNSCVKETLLLDEDASTKVGWGIISADWNKEDWSDVELLVEMEVFCCGIKFLFGWDVEEDARFLGFLEVFSFSIVFLGKSFVGSM